MRILFVDDEKEYTSLLSEWFTGRGHEVDIAEDAAMIPRLLPSHRYDVVSLDLMMPRSNGMSWIEWIRDNSPQTAIVVVSALADLEVAKLAIRQGADDCVGKPIYLQNLESVLEHAFEDRMRGKV